jgi:hypothetical protein
VNRFRERCGRNAWRDRITSACRFVGLRCRVTQSMARVSSDRYFFLVSTRTTVTVAVFFGLCIILNGVPACHKICNMFRCMCRYGVCCVSCAGVMRLLMCSVTVRFPCAPL